MGVYIKARVLPPTYDPDAQAFFTASGLTGATNLTAINNLVVALKGYGIWTKMKAIYPIIGGTAALHKWNLKNPLDTNAAFRLVFFGGMTHSSTGILFGGVNGYGSTFLNGTAFTTNHLSFYSRTLTVGVQIDMGVFTGPPNELLHIRAAANYIAGDTVSLVNYTTTTDARGFWIGTKRANNDREVYRNGVSQATITVNDANTLPSQPVYIGARNFNNTSIDFPTSKECAFASLGDGLTDTEAANFYSAVQAYQVALGRSIGPQTVSDPDAQAFVTAANIDDQVQAQAVNQLVIDMKAANIWTKMKAIYPMVGGTASSHKFNLKNPLDTDAAFRLVFNGGWTHSSTGALPNGTNAFANTYLSPSTSLTNNNTHMSYYSRTNTSGPNKGLIGASVGGSFIPLFTIYGRSGSNVFFMDSYNYNTSRNQQAEPTGQSFLLNTRTSNTSFKSFRNSTLVAINPNTNADNVTGINFPISIGGLNLGGSVSQFSNFECAFSSIGDGLTDTEAANFYSAVQTYNTTLSRQVG